MNALVPVVGRFAPGYPEHKECPESERAVYAPLSVALTNVFEYDAHVAAYSLPSIPRRLATTAALELSPSMVLLLIDVEPAGHAAVTSEWRAAELTKVAALLTDQPNGYYYETRGGYRVVYQLTPLVLTNRSDAARWTASYVSWLAHLKTKYDIVADDKCKDWTRVMRLPFVLRDDIAQTPNTIGDAGNVGVWSLPYTEHVVLPELTDNHIPVAFTGDHDLDKLIEAASVLTAPGVWPTAATGGRHEARLRLTGALAWEGWNVDDIVEFTESVFELAGTPVNDKLHEETAKQANRAIQRIQSNETVPGWNKLKELINPDVVDRARRLLGFKVITESAPGAWDWVKIQEPTNESFIAAIEAAAKRLRASSDGEKQYQGNQLKRVLQANEKILNPTDLGAAVVAMLHAAPKATDEQLINLLRFVTPSSIDLPKFVAQARAFVTKALDSTGDPQTDDEVRGLLLPAPKEGFKACGTNVDLILRHSQELKGKIRFNELAKIIEITDGQFKGENPNTLETGIKNWLEKDWDIFTDKNEVGAQLLRVARLYGSYDPVANYLNDLIWDGVPRIDDMLTKYCGVSIYEGDHVRWFSSKFLISAVARALKPGCKVDTVLILEGNQGIGKSTALGILGGKWFSDTPMVLGDKDSRLLAASKWIIELAELSSLSSKDVETHKAFLSSCKDDFRPPYGRATEEFPRRCVFAGSTNDNLYLRDPTGARRFWPVRAGEVDAEALERDRDQLWAEAVVRYLHGEQWWLTPQQQVVVDAVTATRRIEDPWVPLIQNWAGRQTLGAGLVKLEWTLAEIGHGAIGISAENMPRNQNHLAKALKEAGFEQITKRVDGSKKALWKRCADAAPLPEPATNTGVPANN